MGACSHAASTALTVYVGASSGAFLVSPMALGYQAEQSSDHTSLIAGNRMQNAFSVGDPQTRLSRGEGTSQDMPGTHHEELTCTRLTPYSPVVLEIPPCGLLVQCSAIPP